MSWYNVVQRVQTSRDVSNFEAHDEMCNLHSGRFSNPKFEDPSLRFLVHKAHTVGKKTVRVLVIYEKINL